LTLIETIINVIVNVLARGPWLQLTVVSNIQNVKLKIQFWEDNGAPLNRYIATLKFPISVDSFFFRNVETSHPGSLFSPFCCTCFQSVLSVTKFLIKTHISLSYRQKLRSETSVTHVNVLRDGKCVFVKFTFIEHTDYNQ
jgi:hypothetical protein